MKNCRNVLLILGIFCSSLLFACGYPGPLYLPQDEPKKAKQNTILNDPNSQQPQQTK